MTDHDGPDRRHLGPARPDAFIAIDDLDDPRLGDFARNERGLASRSQKRDDTGGGRFLAEGDLVVERALEAGCRPDRALVDDGRIPAIADAFAAAGGTVFVGGVHARQQVSKLGVPHPIIALFYRPARPSAAQLLASSRRLVVLEGVDNPANVGAIVRNAAGLGWDGLLLDHTSADPFARRSLRVAMGTVFELPHARTTSLAAALRDAASGIDLYALTPHDDATPIDQIGVGRVNNGAADCSAVGELGRRAIMIGSERAGLSSPLIDLATPVRIPMAGGVDSLNAAAATAIACYALA